MTTATKTGKATSKQIEILRAVLASGGFTPQQAHATRATAGQITRLLAAGLLEAVGLTVDRDIHGTPTMFGEVRYFVTAAGCLTVHAAD